MTPRGRLGLGLGLGLGLELGLGLGLVSGLGLGLVSGLGLGLGLGLRTGDAPRKAEHLDPLDALGRVGSELPPLLDPPAQG